jgi:tRNA-splicing ligase RtcB
LIPQFEIIPSEGAPIKAWKQGVPFDEKAIQQLKETAMLPFIYKWVAAMPDTHWGMGATVGSVVATDGAIIPAAVGVDIGCGMMAVRLPYKLDPKGIPNLHDLRRELEIEIPNGRSNDGGEGDEGAWKSIPKQVADCWTLHFDTPYYSQVCRSHPGARSKNAERQLGTLGTGNHFLEISLDEADNLWIVIHSGSRGLGNRIGSYFTRLAKELCKTWFITLPNADLAYLPAGTQDMEDYLFAVQLAQTFAWHNRLLMMDKACNIVRSYFDIGAGILDTVHCHHNYANIEKHFGKNVWVTRKGAVRARIGDFGIIPGSMGACTYIVEGLGSPHSFESCSHGAGRVMSRTEALKRISIEDHQKATEGVECYKGNEVLDESPAAYKPIDLVMEAQRDLVEPVHKLKQILCVKGK